MWAWLSFAALAQSDAPSPELCASLTGTFVRDLDPETLDALLDTAVERTLAGFSALTRPFARGPVSRAPDHCRDWELSLTPERFRAACTFTGLVWFEVGPGEPVPYTGRDGRLGTLSWEVTEDRVAVHQDMGDAVRTTTFVPSERGFLLLERIESNNLAVPLTWQIPYRR